MKSLMKSLFGTVVTILLYSAVAFCQVHQMYQEVHDSFISDEGVGKQFSHLEALPPGIQGIVHRIVTYRVPVRFVGKLTFECGQKIDVHAYLMKEKDQATRRWVVPAYDLRYSFSDSSIGVGRYDVELQLDQDGQVLEMNLPNTNDRYDSLYSPILRRLSLRPLPTFFNFMPLDSAIATSIDTTRNLFKKTDSLLTDLKYDHCSDNLYWLVSFPQTASLTFTVEIDVQTGEVSKIYDTMTTTVY